MPDPLHISQQQPSYEELREQYREANRQRVHRMLREDTITFRDKDGNYLRDKDGKIVVRKTGYMTDAPKGHEHQRLDDYAAQGGRIPWAETELTVRSLVEGPDVDVWEGMDIANPQEFEVEDSQGLQKELRDLDRDAELMRKHEQVRYEED